MSLLSDLTLSYETSANDPIEMGLHYGHNILNILSAKVASEVESVRSFRAPAPLESRRPERRIARGAAATAEPQRANYLNFTARTTGAYTQRNLVGAM